MLPVGFIAPGGYEISGTPGNQVGVTARISIGSPIQIQTPLPPGTVIDPYTAPTIQWTSGDPGTLVKVSLFADEPQGLFGPVAYTYADATAGSVALNSYCERQIDFGGTLCTWGLESGAPVELEIEILPNPAALPTVSGSPPRCNSPGLIPRRSKALGPVNNGQRRAQGSVLPPPPKGRHLPVASEPD